MRIPESVKFADPEARFSKFPVGAIHSTKIPTGPTGKSGPPQRWTSFFQTFPVGRNQSIESWTKILVEWIAPGNFSGPKLNTQTKI